MARFLDDAGITEDDILFSEVNEMNGNNPISPYVNTPDSGTPLNDAEMVTYFSSADRHENKNIVVDQYGRYVFK